MCIMEVRPGQRSSTIAQAMAHNTSTVERDLDMFKPLLEARGEHDLLAQVERAHQHLKAAYADFLSVFAEEVATEVHVHGDHDHHDEKHGSERSFTEQAHHGVSEQTLIEVAHHDAQLARRYETR